MFILERIDNVYTVVLSYQV